MASVNMFCVFVIVALLHGSALAKKDHHQFGLNYQIRSFNRTSFPPGFVFGAASSAYQVEGAWNLDGKGPSIWDAYAHAHPEKIADHSSGDVSADSYHKYKEDVKLLKKMNMDAYRFSIAWPRILPNGKLSGGVNEKGIEYYNKLIDHLLENGIEPYVTLFHWDTPQALEEEYGGFLSSKIVDDFGDFVNLCFERFGDRVKHWITLNEAHTYAISGYENGNFAPFRCSAWKKNNCLGGNSATEPYIVMHNMILAHARASILYKIRYQAQQKGKVGITVVTSWMVPYSDSKSDIDAAMRAVDFQMGWNLEPLVTGDYPKSMRTLVGDRLPRFTEEESKMVKGSFDFFGLNYYSSNYVKDDSHSKYPNPSYATDSSSNSTAERNGVLIGEQAASSWLHFYPKGIRQMLLFVKQKYNDPVIYITENGVDDKNSLHGMKTALKDHFRIKYYYSHLRFLSQAIREGVQVKGYFGWAILDNYEWASGYSVRFGLNYVDFKHGQMRRSKLSAKWFKRFLARGIN